MTDLQAFGITEPEAVLLDPQQRLLLEVIHEAMCSATPSPPATNVTLAKPPMGTRCSVYVGVASSDYGSVVAAYRGAPGPYHATANALSVVAGRVSYVFGLTGEQN